MVKHSPLVLESTSKMIMNGNRNGLTMPCNMRSWNFAWLSLCGSQSTCSYPRNEKTKARLHLTGWNSCPNNKDSFRLNRQSWRFWLAISLAKKLRQGKNGSWCWCYQLPYRVINSCWRFIGIIWMRLQKNVWVELYWSQQQVEFYYY